MDTYNNDGLPFAFFASQAERLPGVALAPVNDEQPPLTKHVIPYYIDKKVVGITRRRFEHLAHTEGALIICLTCASPIASQLHYEALRSENDTTTPDIDEHTNANNARPHLIRTCNIPGATIPDAINHSAIAYIRKCARQITIDKPHECGLSSRHPAPSCIQPTRVPFGYGGPSGQHLRKPFNTDRPSLSCCPFPRTRRK